jgi:hypothetical protein
MKNGPEHKPIGNWTSRSNFYVLLASALLNYVEVDIDKLACKRFINVDSPVS